MSKGYWLVSITISDRTPYEAYVAANKPVFDRWGGRFIVRGGPFETVQGAAGARQVVIEFESYQRALDCYRSDDYQAILPDLLASAAVQMIIVEGTE